MAYPAGQVKGVGEGSGVSVGNGVAVGTGVAVGAAVAVAVRVAVGAPVTDEEAVAAALAWATGVAAAVSPAEGVPTTPRVGEATALTPAEGVALATATRVGDPATTVKVGLGVRVALGVGTGGLERAQATRSANTENRQTNSNLLVTALSSCNPLPLSCPALASGRQWLETIEHATGNRKALPYNGAVILPQRP
jgi:hypothetical protein